MTQLDTFSHARGNYDLVATLFVALLLTSNVAVIKLIAFGPEWSPFGLPVLSIITDGGALLFPLTYALGDVLAEVFGMRGTWRAILLGFGIPLLASLTFLAIGTTSMALGYESQGAFVTVLGFVPCIAIASLTGYLVGQFLNVWVFVKLKQWQEGRGMWRRLLGSTVMGEAANTTIFCLIAFGRQINSGTVLNYIIADYLFKVGMEAVLLPVIYRVISLMRNHEPGPTRAWGNTSTQALELPELLIPGA